MDNEKTMNLTLHLIVKFLRRNGIRGLFRVVKHFYICFDSSFYRRNNENIDGEVFLKFVFPRTHYLFRGQFLGFSPSRYFVIEEFLRNRAGSLFKNFMPFFQYLYKSHGANPVTLWDENYLTLCPEAKNYKFSLLLHYKLHYNTENKSMVNIDFLNVSHNERIPEKILVIKTIIQEKIYKLAGEIRINISNCCKTIIIPRQNFYEFEKLYFNVTRKTHGDCLVFNNSGVVIDLESDGTLNIQSHEPLILDLDKLTEILSSELLDSEKSSKILSLLRYYSSRRNYINILDRYNHVSFQSDSIGKFLSTDLSNQPNLRLHTKLSKTRKPKKVLLISHEDSLSGAPIYLKQLAEELLKNGFSINLVSLRENWKKGVFASLGKKHSYLQDQFKFNSKFKKVTNNWLLTSSGDRALKKVILRNKPDVLIVNSLASCDAIRIASKYEIPTILYVHESWKFELDYSYRKDDFRWRVLEALEASNLVIFGSESSRLNWEETGVSVNSLTIPSVRNIEVPTESEVLKLRKSLRQEFKFSITTKVFLSIANFESRKRINDIVKAFKSFERDDIRLVLIGSNEVNNPGEITSLIDGDSRIHQIESVQNLDPYYALADCLIFASSEETMPLVLQEAAYWKIPRIVSTYPGYEELISNNESAFLFTPKNWIELAHRIQDYLDKSENLGGMINNSLEFQNSLLKNYSQDILHAIHDVSNFQTSVIPHWWTNG
jgi:glycosyltransferase involved in cell wall biosynthesis